MRWIEFQTQNGPKLVNEKYIRKIYKEENGGSWIVIEGGSFFTTDSYASIVNMLKPIKAQPSSDEDMSVTDLVSIETPLNERRKEHE